MQEERAPLSRSQVHVAGESITVLRGGRGPRVLVLHDEWGIDPRETFWSLLAERVEVVAPIAPGFEDAPKSPSIRTVRDLALLYSALLETFGDEPVAIVGVSFGAWIALEMAVMDHRRVAHLALLGPVGLRFGSPDQRNFADLFAVRDEELGSLLYQRPEVARVVSKESPSERVTSWTRNREACALYGWEPYLHQPRLQRWTEHLKTPTAIIHGREDRFVMDGYYEQFDESFLDSVLVEIPGAGHFPHLDEPRLTFEAVESLLSS